MNKNQLLNELKSFLTNDYNIIMIDGPWGSGKTYLLNEFINLKENENIEFYYVSLHGLKNIDEINTRIYNISNPDIKITNVISSVINPFEKQKNTKEILSFSLKNKKYKPDKIVILDDFERYYNSDYDAFLSYLNTLIANGCKIILVANLLDFGSSEIYQFDKYKEKLLDRLYKAELFDSDVINKKFGKYYIYLTPTIIYRVKNNYRLIEKIYYFLTEIENVLNKEHIKISENNMSIFLYYVTTFISSYFESDRLYLNKSIERISPSQEKVLSSHLDNQNSVLEVSLICIEHLNFKGEKPSLTDDYYLFLGLYKAYMYARYDELIEYIKLYLI